MKDFSAKWFRELCGRYWKEEFQRDRVLNDFVKSWHMIKRLKNINTKTTNQ